MTTYGGTAASSWAYIEVKEWGSCSRVLICKRVGFIVATETSALPYDMLGVSEHHARRRHFELWRIPVVACVNRIPLKRHNSSRFKHGNMHPLRTGASFTSNKRATFVMENSVRHSAHHVIMFLCKSI